MGILKFVVWTGCAVGLGIFAATYDVQGRTPLQHVERLWKQQAPKLDSVKETAEDAVDDVKKKVLAKDARPTERHSEADKSAIDQLIAKRQQK